MSSRARKAQKLTKRDSSDSTKHARTSYDNEEYSNQRRQGDGSDESDFDPVLNQDLDSIGIGEFLELDPRPTFVVTPETNFEEGLEPIFSNEALRSNYHLIRSITHNATNSPPTSPKVSSIEFRSWIKESAHHENVGSPFPASFSFCGLLWTVFTIRNRWTIFSGSGSNPKTKGITGSFPLRSESPNTLQSLPQPSLLRENQLARTRTTPLPKSQEVHRSQSFVTLGTWDWTLAQPSGDLSPHVTFARSIDWASTPLGGR